MYPWVTLGRPAVEVAFVVEKKVSRDGMELARHNARANVKQQPAAHLAPYLLAGPISTIRIVSGLGSLSNSGYCGKTASGNLAPLILPGVGPVDPVFARRLWMSTSIRNLAGAGDAMSFLLQSRAFHARRDAVGLEEDSADLGVSQTP